LLKRELFPKYIERLRHNLLLWFKRSNSYVLLPAESETLLKSFLRSSSLKVFSENIASLDTFSKTEASVLFNNFSELIEKSNFAKKQIIDSKTSDTLIPEPIIQSSKTYNIIGNCIEVHYGSATIRNAFHPQLSHLEVSPNSDTATYFHIYKDSDKFLLLKNKIPIFKSTSDNLHYLHGQFAMEITNIIHNKDNEDWLASFHASTVVKHNTAIMIVGPSGNGKSTLTALLVANGYELLADDFTPLNEKDLKLYRFPNAISIKSGAFKTLASKLVGFSELPSNYNESKKTKVKYIPPAKNSISDKQSFQCHQIVYVKYSKDCEPEFRQSNEKDVLSALIPDSWLSPKSIHAKKIINWFKDLEYYQLNYSEDQYALASFNALF